MTWDELVKFAEDYGYFELKMGDAYSALYGRTLSFFSTGCIYSDEDEPLAADRTPEQMKTIIENMYDKEKER